MLNRVRRCRKQKKFRAKRAQDLNEETPKKTTSMLSDEGKARDKGILAKDKNSWGK